MNADGVIALYDGLRGDKQDAKCWADELRKFVLPFSPTALQSKFNFMGVDLKSLHDSTAVRANERLAAAHQSFLSDPGKLWFCFKPSAAMGDGVAKNSTVKKWLAGCAERIYQALAESNFYTVNHQALLDRCGLGTGSFFGGIGNDGRLLFSYVPFDSFVFSEDDHGLPSLLIREFEQTADQAAAFFGGVDRLGDLMRTAYDDVVQRYKRKFTVLHAVGRRDRFDPRSEREFFSVYVAREDKHVLEEGDFEHFPYMVSRFLKWMGQYGVCPGRLCWPDILDLQFGRRVMRVLSELKAFPRTKSSADVVGRINFRPGGNTVVGKLDASLPVTWADGGSYQEVLAEMELHRQSVREAYYLDMIDLFGSGNSGMTATEVNARLEDRLMAFSPTFCQHLNDFRPMMLRIFALMFRARLLDVDHVPRELMIEHEDGSAVFNPQAMPKVVYTSKFAQLMEQVHVNGVLAVTDDVKNMVELCPSIMHRFDFDFGVQELARGRNVPEGFIRDDEEARAAEERVMAMQAAMQAGNQADGGQRM